jgi:hypothetical protein
MTLTPKQDLANHVGFIAEYDDGSKDVFAVPQSTLDQGPPEGWNGIARIVAGEWQRDGHLKPGNIVRVYRDPTIKVT